MMNPQALMQMMSAMNTFRSNHPKFASFIGMFVRDGLPEGSVIEISVTRPGEEKVTTNMKVQQSDLDLMNALKSMGDKM